jgi:two-component system, LuxR family, sensor histidine kinase DctS
LSKWISTTQHLELYRSYLNDMSTFAGILTRLIPAHRVRRNALWVTLLAFVVAVVYLSGNWVANLALKGQVESIQRAISINALGLLSNAEKFSTLPYAVALHPDVLVALKEKENLAVKQLVNQYLENITLQAGSDALYLMNVDGLTIAASNWSSGQTFVGKNYANRPYFIDALRGNPSVFYGIGQTTGIPGLFLATPVFEKDTVIGVVVIKVSLRAVEDAWAGLTAPIMVSDAKGIFFLGSVPHWKFQAKLPLSAEGLQWLRLHKQYGDRQEFTQISWIIERLEEDSSYIIHTKLDGDAHRYLAIDQFIPELGWTLTVMADYYVVIWARLVAWVLGALVAGLLVFSVLYWRLREKRLLEQSTARQELELRVVERTHELHEAHAFQQAMEDSLVIGMRARDLDGRIIYVNSALCEITGYSASALIGSLPPYPYWHQDDLARHWSDNTSTMSGKAALTGFESRIKHYDGRDVFTMVYTAPLVDAAGKHKGWMSSVVDITEQKKIEIKQRLHDTQLQHTGRLVTMGEMASTLAHELNQPLMALCNFASAANAFAKQGNNALLVESLDEITVQAQRSADIVKRIRSFVKPATLGVEVCQLNTVVSSVLALIQPEMKLQHTKIHSDLMENLPFVSGDYVLLEQVVVNLIMNAMQAMQHLPRDQRVIRIETLRGGEWVCITVKDNGLGIAKNIAGSLFEPFFTTKRDGLGLGLNICRTIVERHKGQLTFENQTPNGTIFTLKLKVLI